MLVVAIIAVIAGGVIVKMTGALDVAKIQRTEQDINNLYSALKLYEARNYQMPDQSQGLESWLQYTEQATFDSRINR